MAGKLRVAAKLTLGTTVLAACGAGGYYYTTHGLELPSFAKSETPAASDAALDAVASAWGEPAASRALTTSESSPVARSANTATVLPSQQTGSPVGDRYAAQVSPVVESTAAELSVKEDAGNVAVKVSNTPAVLGVSENEPTETKNSAAAVETESGEAGLPEPNIAEVGPPTPASQSADVRTAATEPASAAHGEVTSDSSPDSALARGQEPKDDAAAKNSNPQADLGAGFDAIASDRNTTPEPKMLEAPQNPARLSEASPSAKEAFAVPVAPAPGDRYSTAASAREGKPATSGGSVVNPFAAKQPAMPPAGAAAGPTEPLPLSPTEISERFTNPEQASGRLQPLQGEAPENSMRRGGARSTTGSLPPREVPRSPYGENPPSPSTPAPEAVSIDGAPVAGEGTGKPGEKALEGPQQPTLVIQKFAPPEIQVGKPAKFVIQVRNVGVQSADDVVVRDHIPQGTKLVSTAPNATPEGGQIVWQIGKLSPGEDRTVEMQVMPISEGEIGSVATVSYSAQASVKTKCTMPQLAIRMTAPSEVMIGNQQHVKIEIKNPGSGDATGVMLFENVPPNVKHVAGPALEFEIGTLRPGETRELDLVLTAEKAGKVLNTLTAKADGNLQVQQQVAFEVIAPALAVAVDGPERRYLERPATYEVSVENPGTASARDVQIVTKLPKGMKFVRANNMGEYDAATHAVYWSLAELPKGERGTVELVAMPTETGPQTLQVEGHAQQGLKDQTQREVVVEGLAAIMFEVRDLEDPIEVGGETGYEIRVVNQGTKAATNVQVVIDWPQSLKVISAEGETPHRVQDGRLMFEPLQQLAPKADSVFKVRAQGLQAGDQRITVQVNTDDLANPIRREESTRVFGDQ